MNHQPMLIWRRSVSVIAVTVFSLCAGAASAGKDEEIAHLFNYIAQSGCTFIRNGKAYPAVEAQKHMAMKYDHVESKIKTTEQFIEHIASRSSISGKPYEIECDGQSSSSAVWLAAELKRFRSR